MKFSQPRRYGQCAYNEKGHPEDPERCIYELFGQYIGRQCSRKRGHGPGGLYCKQHAKTAKAATPYNAGKEDRDNANQ